ncbi:uncharacterized protein LOC127847201 [Dreissena polymorpha]|uniref:KY-like immunoglobulin-like domain-containing protein n=1 Tax=Dreissena polymorpha TaxID=45954 RepID=A0A9D4DLF2_DREPO|nr:uncharacterized protein LOC127847201 [Dreissena polymorpha]XP_052234901.1 uncharacterized protein LOC127847201 [Dreissena polymorpha]XP_052234902.1 uncharacterized protein LOC127847201 [Dreissena polymorpha]XP_052234903.1 uncharacterized protein LOC127847201 [Dreissena polymorpha]XP_052234904.1 uncharacterized protein LOC127847201 [Dreissena polymorpha]XP_052234905.1 uncharacterized protein LOC127847201 [Dreissena polymorpha]XP_052234906.1 uncharacterized protein LOC127847201 [Dreissena po
MSILHSYDEKKLSFHQNDQHVRNIGIEDMQTLRGIVQYFEKSVDRSHVYRDIYIARSILVWMSHMVGSMLIDQLPDEVRNLVDSDSYAPGTFHTLCEAAGIKSVVIVGKAKDITFEPGWQFDKIPQASWNSFRCNNTWHLVFTELAIALVSGYRRGGEIVIESDGKRTFQALSSSAGHERSMFSEFWFCIHPKILAIHAFPDDIYSLYLPKGQSVGEEEFASCALMFPAFFQSRMSLLSENACVLMSHKGRCVIHIACPSVKGLKFKYKLKFLKDTGEIGSLNLRALSRMVVFSPGIDDVTFTISLPMLGHYLFSTSALSDDHNRNPECFKFKIICNEIDAHCRNIPQSVTEMGVGFTYVAKEFGLKQPTNASAILKVYYDSDQESASDEVIESEAVRFRVAEDRINEVEFTSDFLDDVENIGFSEVNLNKDKGELEVKAGLKKAGERVLVVKGREIASDQNFKPVLNYIVSSYEKTDDSYEKNVKKNKRIEANKRKRDAKESFKAQLEDLVLTTKEEIKKLYQELIDSEAVASDMDPDKQLMFKESSNVQNIRQELVVMEEDGSRYDDMFLESPVNDLLDTYANERITQSTKSSSQFTKEQWMVFILCIWVAYGFFMYLDNR